MLDGCSGAAAPPVGLWAGFDVKSASTAAADPLLFPLSLCRKIRLLKAEIEKAAAAVAAARNLNPPPILT